MLEAVVDRVYAAARAAAVDDESAAEVTRRVLLADPRGRPDTLAVRGARLAALTVPHPALAPMAPADREAVVLAHVLGWTVDEIADGLAISRADVLARLGRGLRRTPQPPPDYATAASPARAGHGS